MSGNIKAFHSSCSPTRYTNNWTLLGSHCRYLISTLNKKTYRGNVAEIAQLETLYESEVELFVLKCLINQIDWKDTKRQKDQCRIQLLSQRIAQFSTQPNFASLICETLEEIPSLVDGFFNNFSKSLKLTPLQEITLALGMVQSLSKHVKQQGLDFLKPKLAALANGTATGGEKLPDRLIHTLLAFIRDSPEDDFLDMDREKIMESFRKTYGSVISFVPMLNPQPTRNDAKRNWKKEAKMRLSPFLKDLDKSFSPAEIIADLGYSSFKSIQSLKKVLDQFPLPLSASSVAEVIGMMIGYHKARLNEESVYLHTENSEGAEASAPGTWNIDVFSQVMKDLCPELNWTSVMEHLDYPDFWVHDQTSLALLLNIFRKVTDAPFNIQQLFRKWKNVEGQLSFLKAAMDAPKEVFQFPVTLSFDDTSAPDSPCRRNFSCLHLVTTLLRISNENVAFYSEVNSLFQSALASCPGTLLVALTSAQIPKTHCTLKSELMDKLLSQFFDAPPTEQSNAVLSVVWNLEQGLFIERLKTMCTKSEPDLPRMYEIAISLKALPLILDACALTHLALDLALLAHGQGQLALDKWLEEMLQKNIDPFAMNAIGFLKQRINQHYLNEREGEAEPTNPPAPLKFEVIQIFLDALRNTSSRMSATIQEELRQLVVLLENEVFPSDIEKEANIIFSRIYDGEINIDQIIQLLKTFKDSNSQRELKIFECMVQSLYEEYPHIPKYPEKELQITGVLFGSLIQHQLVSYIPLVIALRYILEALKQPVGSKLFKFGIYALEQFTSRLAEWPQYCSHLRQIQHLQIYHPALFQHIDAIYRTSQVAQSQASTGGSQDYNDQAFAGEPTEPVRPEPEVIPPEISGGDDQYDGNSQDFDTEDPAPPAPRVVTKEEENQPRLHLGSFLKQNFPIIEPTNKVMDIIHFVFNNVSTSTMETKARDLKLVLAPELFDYLSYYLVVTRVSQEESYHELYCNFIHKLQFKDLNKKLMKFTVTSIRALLEFGRIRTDQSDRALLKNLGSWLGLWTIARDLPLRHIDLAPKDCLLRAYESGSLLAVVPFVSKILQQGCKSKWFKPPNPWVMAIVGVLVEIYRLPHLTVNLKFEIEILSNTLGIKLETATSSDLLKGLKVYTGPGAIFDFDSLPEEPQDRQPKFHVPFVHISPSLPLFRQQPQLKKAVYLAINRAIQDIIAPVVDRLVMIASITARELVLKDFAMEPDENKMLRASCSMVQSLAGNLASVTCKDPLRNSIMNNLRGTLGVGHNKPVPAHIEHVIHTIVTDNLDLACSVVQKAAAEAAVRTTEEQLADAITSRKTHRERSGRRLPFYDINFVGSTGYAFAQTLPDSLKPKIGGVSAEQIQVYEDFMVPSPVNPTSSNEGFDGSESGFGDYSLDSESKHTWGPQDSELEAFPHAGMEMNEYPERSMYEAPTPTHGHMMTGYEAPSPYPDPDMTSQDLDDLENRPESPPYPGFSAASFQGRGGAAPPPKMQADQLDLISRTKKIDQFVAELMNALLGLQQIRTLSELPPNHPVVRMFSRVSTIVMSSQHKYEVSVYTAQLVFPKLFKRALLHREACLTVIDVLVNVVPSIRMKIAELLIASPAQQKFHREVVPALLHYNLLAIQEYDTHLANLVMMRDAMAVEFANYLLQHMIKTTALAPRDLIHTLEALAALSPNDFDLVNLVETVRSTPNSPGVAESTPTAAPRRKPRTEYDFRSRNIPDSFRTKVVPLLNEWLDIYAQGNEKLYAGFLTQLQQRGLYAAKESISEMELSFYQVLVESAIAHAFTPSNQDAQERSDALPKLNLKTIDAVAKLFVLFVKYYSDKVTLMYRLLNEIGRVVHEAQGQPDQRPYYRMFGALLQELNSPEPIFEPILLSLLLEFRDIFHELQPSSYPGFTFGWLKLISNPMFMPKLLKAGPDQDGWVPMQELIVDLFRFMEPWLRDAKLSPPIKLLYQGTLRTLLVLLHDFPEFLCNFHFSFCDAIPTTCIQLRNLILSAFPHTMKLPDPFIPNLKVDLLAEIKEPPHIQSNFWEALVEANLKPQLDAFLRSSKPLSFLTDLMHTLTSTAPSGQRYNVPLINSVVLYVGARALSEPAECSPQAPMEIFRNLAINCDTEGRYLLFNAIANQLRYPNNHTHYFSCVLLFLFAEASHEIIQEQITRVLVERLIVHRPHPWGLLITFIELIKNPRYNFWSRSFTRCAPEIERLFFQVGSHIAQHKSE